MNVMKKQSIIAVFLLLAVSLMAQNPVPLYVVDGIITSDISALSENDIRAMYVYKDDIATHVYGDQAKNGVVLIVTKQGNEAQKIRSFAIDEHDVSWYEHQAYMWKEKITENSQNEEAWSNYFKAIRYSEIMCGYENLPRCQELVKEMHQAIPDTYTYYVCMSRLNKSVDTNDSTDYGQLALSRLPEKVGEDDVFELLGDLWMKGAADDSTSVYHDKWLQLINQQYKERIYPERVLRYIHNQFMGMESNALYFANGDMALFPAKLLQDAMGVHKDKQVIAIGLLGAEDYLNSLYKKLGIAPFKPSRKYDFTNSGDYNAYFAELVEYIIHATDREAYFFPNLASQPNITYVLSNKLYNEGLLLHYSEQKYDNLAVTKHNVEKRYHLEYLTEPNFGAQEWWSGNERMQMNYVVLLSHLVREYLQEGNKEKARWLSHILRMSVVNTPVDDDTKKTYLNILIEEEK